MTVKIFVEGGGDNEDTVTRCRQAFSTYCAKVCPGAPRPKIVPRGGRDQAFKDFQIAVQKNKAAERYALLVDSEGAVSAATPVAHLSAQDQWNFPRLRSHHVFLMVQAMEAWFLADREALQTFYGDGFLSKSLPGSATSIESILKSDLESKLNHAAKPTTKQGYHKTKHGFALLSLIDPKKVEKASPHAANFHKFLSEQLR